MTKEIRRRVAARHLAAMVGAAVLGASGSLWAQATGEPTALEKIRQKGRLTVAVYNELAPFHEAGKGIEVGLAQALAKALGVQLSLLPFNAGEEMNDDLRNMVWRGHYLGFGPADVLLHVPVEPQLMQGNPRVKILAPYYRERVMIARNVQTVPTMDSLAAFKGQRIAVPGQSLAGWLLIGADSGAYRDQLMTKLKSGQEAAELLLKGDVAAAAGHASELESVLGKDPRFVVEPLPLPRMREGWAVGLAVKSEATDLALALQAAVNELNSNGQMAALFEQGRVSWRKP